ncbi:MAG: hypothetical protein AAF985_18370 [Bacteroidota bacterium]
MKIKYNKYLLNKNVKKMALNLWNLGRYCVYIQISNHLKVGFGSFFRATAHLDTDCKNVQFDMVLPSMADAGKPEVCLILSNCVSLAGGGGGRGWEAPPCQSPTLPKPHPAKAPPLL